MHTLTIETLNRGTIELGFSDLPLIARVIGIQTGVFHGYINDDDLDQFLSILSSNLTKRFQERERLGVFDNLDENSIIVDIGAGSGWFDIAISKYIGGGTFVMVDKNEWTSGYASTQWDSKYKFYNEWSVFDDLTAHTDMGNGNFIKSTPEDAWPDDIDLIFSGYSYLWHYPKEIYWDRISNTSASLSFDILNKENSMQQINDDLGIECAYIPKPKILYHMWLDTLELDENGSPGKCCYWRR